MELEEKLKKALEELRKTKKRKFEQTVDLIVNLQKIDLKKNQLNFILTIPHKIKDKKIAGFLETKKKNIKTITPQEFKEYSDKKKLKKLIDEFDFFIAEAKLMPKIATSFGRILGPAGKMPSPQLGILRSTDEKEIENLKKKINNSVKIKLKEASIKLAIGKEGMDDKNILENVLTTYNFILKELPRGKENIKNIELKFTMTKPQKIKLK